MPEEQSQTWGEYISSWWSSSTSGISTLVQDVAQGSLYTVDDIDLAQKEYDFTYRAFPADLGMSDVGHYMVININVPVKLDKTTARTDLPTTFANQTGDFSKVDVLRFGNVESYGANQREFMSIPRYTKRIKESIALYMPTPPIYTSSNQYAEVSMTDLAGPLIGAAAGAAIAGVGGAIIGALDPTGARDVEGPGSNIPGVGKLSQIAGMPINPRVEILFANTQQRNFIFSFLLGPRNEKESQTIQEIIKTLRYHAAPEIGTMLGATWIPPAEFDITFYHKGEENTKIPRINTCVLRQIDVNYAPHSDVWATFSNGHPVSVYVQLTFTEVEVAHKLRILQGF